MDFNSVLNDIRKRYENKKNGYYNCIPFSLERMSNIVPGIIPGEYYLITGSSGSAKSKIARSLFIHDPYVYVTNHPELDIKFDVLYWALEEGAEKVCSIEISRRLKKKYGITRSYRDLMSIGENSQLDEEDIRKMELMEAEISDWAKHVHVYSANDANPTGIMKQIEKVAYGIGKYYKKDGTPFNDEEMNEVRQGKGEWLKEAAYYKTDHPRHYVIVMIDHVGLINTEKGISLKDSIFQLSTVYLLRAKNRFGFIPVIVQQQASQKEKKQYTSGGNAIEEKVEPSLDALAECTTTHREATIAFGIFSPAHFQISNHNGYNIEILRDNYRSLMLLKQRDEIANVSWPLYFEGENDFFKTLPADPEHNKESMNKIYEYVINKRNERKKKQISSNR